MNRIVLAAACSIALHGAWAADAAPKSSAASASAAAAGSAAASAHAQADTAKTEAARSELAELRTQMQELSRKMAALSSELGEGGPRSYAFRYLGDPGRAMIGVVLATDPKGARLTAVTPDGPAARAGLHDGDVITAIDNQRIEADTPAAALAKARKLLENLKENQNVSIEYRRGAENGVVVFAAERREAWNWAQFMNEDPEHPFLPKDFNARMQADVDRATKEATREWSHQNGKQIRDAMDQARKQTREALRENGRAMRFAMPWWGLNLAPLNSDLGRYFGTDKGVLVIAADERSLPGIRGGDVITSIAGETVARPEDALRALRDRHSDKDVAIKLLRDRKTLALNMKAPEFNSIFNLMPPPPEPPAPPQPPAPPSAVGAPSIPSPPAAPAPPAPPDHAAD